MKSADVVTGKAYAEFYQRDQKHISNVVIFLDSPKRLYSTARGGGFERSESAKAGRDPSRGGRKAGYAIVRVFRPGDYAVIERCRMLTLEDFLTNAGSPARYKDWYEFDILMTTAGLSGETPEEAEDRERRLRRQSEEVAAAARVLNDNKEARARELAAALRENGITSAGVLSSWRVAVGMTPEDALRLIKILGRSRVFEDEL